MNVNNNITKMASALLAFSVYTNTRKFLNTSHQPPGSLAAIHGIRFLSMTWVILGHMYVFGIADMANPVDVLDTLSHWTQDAVSNALVSVDTFFTLSGLLTSYMTVREMRKRGSWKINWGMFYFHRFWRLTPPYMLTLLFALGFSQYFGSGATWSNSQPYDKVNCERYWWGNLLYVNNLISTQKMCFGHSWYLSNDMQFYILSPLMLVPLYFRKSAGLFVCSLFLLTTWVTTISLSVKHSWPANFFSANITAEPKNIGSFGADYYMKPWCRIGPFVVGVVTGYFLAVHRGRIPLSRPINVLGWLSAAAVGLSVVYGLRGDMSGEAPSSVGVAAVYNGVARSAWAACVCWVVTSCTAGYGGPVTSLLTWRPLVPLSRLTYLAYLVHPTVIKAFFGNQEQLYVFSNVNIVFSYLGVLCVSNMAAFLLTLVVESPMIGLEKALMGKR